MSPRDPRMRPGPNDPRLITPRTGPPQPEVIPLGYLEGALWRLVVHHPSPGTPKDEPVPEVHRQEQGHPHWDLVGRSDVLSRLVYQAWRRGREERRGSGLLTR
ncbi:MAG: hypothetical protein M5U22_04740 [Thermoleophilia bacterium]|nr:hypothetical protein [Thermoleophilia bacterium]